MGTRIVQLKLSDSDQFMLRILKDKYGVRTDAGVIRLCLAAMVAGQVPDPADLHRKASHDKDQGSDHDESHDT